MPTTTTGAIPAGATIKPTVGRMVYYKTRGSADGVYPPKDFAAIITEVCDGEASQKAGEDCVNLVTFGPAGIRFEQHVMRGDTPGCWDWMPFQKDQQARLVAFAPNQTNGAVTGSIGAGKLE